MSSLNLIESLENRTLLSAFTAHINFQPKAAPTPAGYTADVGTVFRATKGLSFGWTAKNPYAVDRNSRLSPDQRYDTFNQLNPGSKGASWEIAVPNGTYQVHIVAGDPLDKGNVYRMKVEKTTVIDGKSTAKKHWVEGTAVVKVLDGRLTIAGLNGAVRNKIDFVDIVQTTDPTQKLEAEAADLASGTALNDTGTAVTSLDGGDYLKFSNVLFNSKIESVFASLSVSPDDAGQYIEFRLDSANGTLLGVLKAQPTGRNGEFVMKKDLRKGKIFIDWSQNDEHKTTVAVYSLRARNEPTVSTPVEWDELTTALKKKDANRLKFLAPDVIKRVDKIGDLFEPVLKLKQKLPSM